MTAETLKPFITPTSAVNHFPAKPTHVTHSKRNPRQLIAIILGIIALVLVAGILTLTIWQTIRVRQLDSDLDALRRDVASLRQRLGIDYLEEIAEFQNEYTNLLIHDPSKLDDLEAEEDEDEDDDDDDNDADNDGEEDDEDDSDFDSPTWQNTDEEDEDEIAANNARLDYTDYLDLIKKEQEDSRSTEKEDETAATATTSASSGSDSGSSSSPSSSSSANDDNVFDDFTSYNDSKKKKERKSRSIATMRNELQSNDLATNRNNDSRTEQKPKESTVNAGVAATTTLHHSRVHRMRPRRRQSRQRVLVRKGESPVSAKSADSRAPRHASLTAAAHFHLNSKVPHHKSLKLNSYDGDMYMGHATASSDNQWQQDFTIDNGVLTVQQPGLYYVYAQICYNNTHDQNGFIIFHGQHPFLQCLNTVPTNMPQKVHTCHTSGLIQLQEQESIHLRDIHQHRNVILRDANNRSFFGIIKL